ncbi:unnamed protein product, partial [Prorocentrum cordatum]
HLRHRRQRCRHGRRHRGPRRRSRYSGQDGLSSGQGGSQAAAWAATSPQAAAASPHRGRARPPLQQRRGAGAERVELESDEDGRPLGAEQLASDRADHPGHEARGDREWHGLLVRARRGGLRGVRGGRLERVRGALGGGSHRVRQHHEDQGPEQGQAPD